MRYTAIIALVATGSAFVIPEGQVFDALSTQFREQFDSARSRLPSKHEVVDGLRGVFDEAVETTTSTFDDAVEAVSRAADSANHNRVLDEFFDVGAWIETSHGASIFGGDNPFRRGPKHRGPKPPHHEPHHEEPPHRGPPHHEPPHHEPPRDGPAHDGPPHDGPDHEKPPPHSGFPNLTVYQLIAGEKHTTKLAALINEDEELVKLLNSTEANYTLFAPINEAFDKIPKDREPPKEFIKKLLRYHVADGRYPSKRLFFSHTVPTLYEPEPLNGQQRLSVKLGLRGLTLNFYSRFIVKDFPATNGFVHGIDSILLPPPPSTAILNLLPTSFSTLNLGLHDTGLLELLRVSTHVGSTFFAPDNNAFKHLGPRLNAFLFSRPGRKYLKALLQYHVVHNQTLYSDAFYGPAQEDDAADAAGRPPPHFHVDLPTLLEGHHLSIDVGRWGPLVDIRINGFANVKVSDGVALDGALHAVSRVLIPPRSPKKGEIATAGFWMGEEMEVEELMERLEPFVQEEKPNWEL